MLRQVTDEIVTADAAQLFLTIEHADGRTETLATTDEHPFWVEDGRGFVRADELAPGDALRAATGESLVRGLSISGKRTTVYNLTVDGVHTYLVGPDGVWVHNCEKIFVRSFNRGMGEALSWLDSKGASQLTDDVISRFPRQGPSRRIGRQTADGKSGWRLEYDGRHGAHINVWHGKSADTPHIVIEQFNSADVDAILRQLFP